MQLVRPEEEKRRIYSAGSQTHLVAEPPTQEQAAKPLDATYPNCRIKKNVSLTTTKDAPAAENFIQATVLRIAR